MIRKLFFIHLLMLLAVKTSLAQVEASTQNLSAPSSGSISGKVVTNMSNIYNTDLYTGTVNVSIPIYNYSVDGVNLDVSLSYNTSGIKVDQIASNVGLGWSLFTGGSISREVYGIEDELCVDAIDTAATSGGTHNNAVGANCGMWTQGFGFQGDLPDVFTAVIGNRTIKFMMQPTAPSGGGGDTFVIQVTPLNGVLVDVTVDGYDISHGLVTGCVPNSMDQPPISHWLHFKITDEMNNRYYFERGDYQVRNNRFQTYHYTHNTGERTYTIPTSWVLTKVETHSGATITYTYEEDDNWMFYPGYKDQRVEETLPNYWTSGGVTINRIGDIRVINEEVELKQFVRRLKQIDYPNGDKVEFIADGTPRIDVYGGSNHAITAIKISKGYDATVSNAYTYQFKYKYFNSATGGNELSYPTNSGAYPAYNQRLKLTEIDKVGRDNTTTETFYKFDYATDTMLPARLSGLTDCYGYFNNVACSTATISSSPYTSEYADEQTKLDYINIPQHTFSFVNHAGSTITATYGRTMDPNWKYAKACLLKTVTNGLGGSVDFIYGDHNLTTVSTPSPDLLYTTANDGVCIKAIATRDGYNADNNTWTEYVFSNGQRFFPGGHFSVVHIVEDYPSDTTIKQQTYQNSFVRPIDYFRGSNHGYTNATVNLFGYSGEFMGSEEYTFTNLTPDANERYNDTLFPSGYSRIFMHYHIGSRSSHRRTFETQYLGLTKSVTKKSPLGHTLSHTENWYNEVRHYSSYYPFTAQYFSEKSNFFEEPARPVDDLGGGSEIDFPRESVVNLTRSVTTEYSGSSAIVTDKTYDYFPVTNDLAGVKWNDSKGNILSENYIYHQFTDAVSYGSGGSYRIRPHKLTRIKGTYGLINKSGSSYYTHYDKFTFASGVSGIVTEEHTLFDTAAVGFTTGTPPLIKVKEYRVFDDHSNVLETGYNNNLNFSSYIWDTRIGEKLASAKNAKYEEIAYSSFEGTFEPWATDDYNRGNWRFDPGNVVTASATDKAITGHYYFNLPSSASIQSVIAPSAKKYFISLWYKGTMPDVGLTSTTISLANRITVDGWTLATATFTGDGTSVINITLSSGSTKIDELRLHPFDAVMKTYTYEPLVGISSFNNERNVISYFEYDAMGRQTVTRDMQGNIISLTKQVVQGNDN